MILTSGVRWFTRAILAVNLIRTVSAVFPAPARIIFDDRPILAIDGLPRSVPAVIHWSNNFLPSVDDTPLFTYQVLDDDNRIMGDSIKAIDKKGSFISEVEFGPIVFSGVGIHNLTIVAALQGDVENSKVIQSRQVRVIPGIVSIIPLAFVLIFAIAFRQVIPALWLGIWLASTILYGGNAFAGFLAVLDKYLLDALVDADHIQIILFTWFLAGMIQVIIRGGGAQGLAQQFGKVIKTRWSAQWVTLLVGVLIFFDDYASVLITGNNMRIATDLVHLSHEKLAFIVHSTGSAVVCLLPISSWVGMEVALIQQYLPASMNGTDAFEVFVSSIPAQLFPWYILVFTVFLIAFKKDFGPMLYAERRAAQEGKVVRDSEAHLLTSESSEGIAKPGIPLRWWNAVIPLVLMVVAVVTGLFVTGKMEAIRKHEEDGEPLDLSINGIVGNGNSYGSLLYAAFSGSVVVFILYGAQRLMSLTEMLSSWLEGIRGIIESALTLTFAWGVGAAMEDLRVAQYVVSGLGENLNPGCVPALVFLFSCIISFATGTSWGTMPIVFPLGLPLAAIGGSHVVVLTIAAIITGSVFGDMSTPISDTTILSSVSSGVSLTSHVTSNLPYVLTCALLSMIMCLPAGFGVWPNFVSLLAGIPILALLAFVLGTKVESSDRSKFWFIERYFARRKRDEQTEELALSDSEKGALKD